MRDRTMGSVTTRRSRRFYPLFALAPSGRLISAGQVVVMGCAHPVKFAPLVHYGATVLGSEGPSYDWIYFGPEFR